MPTTIRIEGNVLRRDGKVARSEGCCCGGSPPSIPWSGFDDTGRMSGGQFCALREYTSPSAVPASPFVVGENTLEITPDAPSVSCGGANYCALEIDDAYSFFQAARTRSLTIAIEGDAGPTDEIIVDVKRVNSMNSTIETLANMYGIGDGMAGLCEPPGPVVIDPPETVTLLAGEYYRITVTTIHTDPHTGGVWFKVTFS